MEKLSRRLSHLIHGPSESGFVSFGGLREATQFPNEL
jgi:hypothetical protein